MKNNLNAWILKQKEELEKKLAKEISSDFSISEKLAKKFIYETHLSLEDFKKQLQKEKIKNNELKEKLTKQKVEKLYFAILWAKKLIEDLSKKDLEKLKNILEKKEFVIWEVEEVLEKIFSKNLIGKAKNPNNISEHIMWASLWILNSTVVIWELLYSIWIWILKTPSDLYAVFTNTWEIDSLKKI